MQWIIHESCQCILPYDISLQDSYFTCTASDYAIFRAKLSVSFESQNAVNLASLKANLSSLLAKEDKIQITINGGKYFIEPGPCGLTVPKAQLSTLLGQCIHTVCCFHFSSQQHCHHSCGHHECCNGASGARWVHCFLCHWTEENVSANCMHSTQCR